MKSVIFDTDIGIDDAMALLFLHRAEGVRIAAITTRFGNASVEDTTRNALAVAEQFGIDAPVYRGAAGPLAQRLGEGFPEHVHGKNGLGNIRLNAPSSRPRPLSAHEAIVDLADMLDEKLSIIAVGGLTNVALALELEPALCERIADLIVMGGAFGYNGHRGNVSPVAEANIASDPLAADIVFRSGIPTTVVGLDVTHEVELGEKAVDRLAEDAGSVGRFIKESSKHYFEFHRSITGNYACPLHDACAVAYCLRPDLFQTIAQSVRVVTDGIAIGQTIHGDNLREYVSDAWDELPENTICTAVDSQAVLDLFLSTLASRR